MCSEGDARTVAAETTVVAVQGPWMPCCSAAATTTSGDDRLLDRRLAKN